MRINYTFKIFYELKLSSLNFYIDTVSVFKLDNNTGPASSSLSYIFYTEPFLLNSIMHFLLSWAQSPKEQKTTNRDFIYTSEYISEVIALVLLNDCEELERIIISILVKSKSN